MKRIVCSIPTGTNQRANQWVQVLLCIPTEGRGSWSFLDDLGTPAESGAALTNFCCQEKFSERWNVSRA